MDWGIAKHRRDPSSSVPAPATQPVRNEETDNHTLGRDSERIADEQGLTQSDEPEKTSKTDADSWRTTGPKDGEFNFEFTDEMTCMLSMSGLEESESPELASESLTEFGQSLASSESFDSSSVEGLGGEESAWSTDELAESGPAPMRDPSLIHTRPGQVLGTPSWMAPEQAWGRAGNADERSDVFSLGGILCAILTGHPPFLGASAPEVMRLVQCADLDDAFERLDQCEADPELIALAKRCLSPEPEERPADAGMLAEETQQNLESVQARLQSAEMRRVAPEAQADAERKRRVFQVVLASVLAGMLVIAVVVWSFWANHVSREEGLARAEVEQLLSEAEQAWDKAASSRGNTQQHLMTAQESVAAAMAFATNSDRQMLVGLVEPFAAEADLLLELDATLNDASTEELKDSLNSVGWKLDERRLQPTRNGQGDVDHWHLFGPPGRRFGAEPPEDRLGLGPNGPNSRPQGPSANRFGANPGDGEPGPRNHQRPGGPRMGGGQDDGDERSQHQKDHALTTLRRYHDAFKNFGITPASTPATGAADLISKRPLPDDADEATDGHRSAAFVNLVIISMNRWLGVAAHQSLAGDRHFASLRSWIVDVLVLVDSGDDQDTDHALEWRRDVRRAIAGAMPESEDDFTAGQRFALLFELADKQDVSDMDPTLLWLLSMHLQPFDEDESNELLLRAQREHVGNFLVNRTLGQRMMEERELNQAIRYMTAAVVARPHGKTFADLGRLLEMRGKTDDAFAMFKNGLRLNPRNPLFYRDCIEFLCRQKNYKLAREWVNQALSSSGVEQKHNERWTLVMLSSYIYEHGERDIKKACDVITDFLDEGHYPAAVKHTMESRVEDLIFAQ